MTDQQPALPPRPALPPTPQEPQEAPPEPSPEPSAPPEPQEAPQEPSAPPEPQQAQQQPSAPPQEAQEPKGPEIKVVSTVNLDLLYEFFNNLTLLLGLALSLIVFMIFILSIVNVFLIFYYTLSDIFLNMLNFNNIYLNTYKHNFLSNNSDLIYISLEQNYISQSAILFSILFIICIFLLLLIVVYSVYAYFKGLPIINHHNLINYDTLMLLGLIFVFIAIRFVLYYILYFYNILSDINNNIKNISETDNFIYSELYPKKDIENNKINVYTYKIDKNYYDAITTNDLDYIREHIIYYLDINDLDEASRCMFLYIIYQFLTENINKNSADYDKVIKYIIGGKDEYNISLLSLLTIQNTKLIDKKYYELDIQNHIDEKTANAYSAVQNRMNENINIINKYILENQKPYSSYIYIAFYIFLTFIINLTFFLLILNMLVKGGDNGKIKMPDFMKSSVNKINEFVQSAIGFI